MEDLKKQRTTLRGKVTKLTNELREYRGAKDVNDDDLAYMIHVLEQLQTDIMEVQKQLDVDGVDDETSHVERLREEIFKGKRLRCPWWAERPSGLSPVLVIGFVPRAISTSMVSTNAICIAACLLRNAGCWWGTRVCVFSVWGHTMWGIVTVVSVRSVALLTTHRYMWTVITPRLVTLRFPLKLCLGHSAVRRRPVRHRRNVRFPFPPIDGSTVPPQWGLTLWVMSPNRFSSTKPYWYTQKNFDPENPGIFTLP